MTSYPHLFSPITVGRMELRNRVMVPPHVAQMGPLWGTQAEADKHVAYIQARARAGVAWFDSVTGHIDNRFVPGFDPVGVGARTKGYIRLPHFSERIGQLGEAVHSSGAVLTVQLVSQGGLPNASSATLSSPMLNAVPHVLTAQEIAWYVNEFAWSAQACQAAGADGVEFHLNHDDLLEWFISPLTNQRTDAYGGSFDKRLRIVTDILRQTRELTGDQFTVGIRLNMFEEGLGGYDVSGGVAIAQALEATGMIDFVSLVVGSNWGNPSYIQSQVYAPAQWADLSGLFVKALSIPVAYTGRVTTPEVAETVLAAEQAHVIGLARAVIADPQWVSKAQLDQSITIRPCTGCNDCISASLMEKLPLSCSVNPMVGTEGSVTWPVPATRSRSVLVIGGGPAGMEVAALCAERGHAVRLWERASTLGGQLRTATKAPCYDQYLDFLRWQETRLQDAGVEVTCDRAVDATAALAADADIIIVATGARSRRPDIAGIDRPNVHDVRSVLEGQAEIGREVVVVAQDDHMAPLAVADYLSTRGHLVTLIYATNGPAPLLSRYTIGGIMARLDSQGVRVRVMEQVIGIADDAVHTQHVYSRRANCITEVDDVVLACGSASRTELLDQIVDRHSRVHVIGDAFAPRRLLFASKQAFALAQLLDQ